MTDRDGHLIIAHEMFELFGEVRPEQRRPSDRAGVATGGAEPRKRAHRGRGRRNRVIIDSQLGIGKGTGGAGLRVGADSVACERLKGGPQIADGLVVEGLERIEQGGDRLDLGHHGLACRFVGPEARGRAMPLTA